MQDQSKAKTPTFVVVARGGADDSFFMDNEDDMREKVHIKPHLYVELAGLGERRTEKSETYGQIVSRRFTNWVNSSEGRISYSHGGSLDSFTTSFDTGDNLRAFWKEIEDIPFENKAAIKLQIDNQIKKFLALGQQKQ